MLRARLAAPLPALALLTRWRRPRAWTVILAALVAWGVLAGAPAHALPRPAVPVGAKLAAATGSSLTVTANATPYATGYRLYASTTRSSVYVANIARAQRSAVFATPRATLSGLPYSTATWHFRFAAVNASGPRYSEILTGHLRPATPTNPRARSSKAGTSLTWGSGAALGYRIAQSTNPAMTIGRVNYTVTSRALQFTPYGLRPGSRYYFRISARNGATGSGYSTQVSVVAGAREHQARVMTYNVLASNTAGAIQGDGPLASWAQRRAGVIRLIGRAAPDVIAIQEGNGWVGSVQGYGGKRQVDDLAKVLGDPYAGAQYRLARTETPPTEHHYLRTGRYLLYKSTYAAVGAGGFWEIGTSSARRFAAYQVLSHRATGARALFVSVHLSAQGGLAGDRQRKAETERLIRKASSYAGYRGLPVVYAGDFNSHEGSNHAVDGPGLAFRAARATDAFEVAQSRVNAQYNSANQNYRRPPAHGRSIDHVYASPGVALRSWQLWHELRAGAFVGPIPSDHNPVTADISYPW